MCNYFYIFEKTNCVITTYLSYYAISKFIQETCVPQCPLECNSTQISYSSISYDILGDAYVDYIKQNANLSSDFKTVPIDTERARQSVARMNIYYDTLSYTISEDFAKWDIITLIASIGGNLGLFLGVCMFSFVEIFTTLLQIYFYQKKNKRIMNSH